MEEFYRIMNVTKNGINRWRFEVSIDDRNSIFRGHFPGHPLVPGVCMMTMMSACAAKVSGSAVEDHVKVVRTVKSCKLKHHLVPDYYQRLWVDVETDEPDFTASVYDTSYQYATMCASFYGTQSYPPAKDVGEECQ